MVSFLILGFLIGISHALEADHLAAVGALAISGKSTPKRLAFLGASWGMGHTTTLFLLSATVIGFGIVLNEYIAAGLELMVGLMLVLLGAQVFWKLRKSKIHFHIHQHNGGKKHIHAHSHAGSKEKHTSTNYSSANHSRDQHEHKHTHEKGFSPRAFFIGLAHGAAGSAGIVALTAAATQDIWTALLYVLVFGLGSIIGMMVLSYAISWPIRLSEGGAVGAFQFIQGSVACVAVYIGITIIIANGPLVLSGMVLNGVVWSGM